jgi:hypothetical protein
MPESRAASLGADAVRWRRRRRVHGDGGRRRASAQQRVGLTVELTGEQRVQQQRQHAHPQGSRGEGDQRDPAAQRVTAAHVTRYPTPRAITLTRVLPAWASLRRSLAMHWSMVGSET